MLKNTLSAIHTNYQGKCIKRKIVVFQSDDWGTIRTPKSKPTRDFIQKSGFGSNPFLNFDTLETESDLTCLYEVLSHYSDYRGNNPIFTTNHVVGNPDFNRIKSANFDKYFIESTIDTYRNLNSTNQMNTYWQQGISNKLINPEFHSREHVDFILWLTQLKKGNLKVKEAFDLGFWGIPLDANNFKNQNLMATYDSFNQSNKQDYLNSISEGIAMFNIQFGKFPTSFIPNNYIFPLTLIKELASFNIDTMQGMKYIYLPKEGKNIPREQKRRINGQQEIPNSRIVSLVRNVQFEPALFKDKLKTLNLCLNQIKWSFLFGKPAIIDTHRLNYVGGLSKVNRDENLKLLKQLINEIIKKWPDVEFESTENLGKLYKV
jgi:hypothetical protein